MVIELFELKQSVYATLSADNTAAVRVDTARASLFRLSKGREYESDVNKIATEIAVGATFKRSVVNDAIFSAYYNPMAFDAAGSYIRCIVTMGGIALPFDRITVSKCDASGWQCELVRAENHWAALALQTLIKDIDLGVVSFTTDAATDSWAVQYWETGVSQFKFDVIDFGGLVDPALPNTIGIDPGVKTVATEDLRPFINWWYLLNAGFCAIGWTIDCQLFELDRFRALWRYMLKQDFYEQSTGGDHRLVLQSTLDYTFTGFIRLAALDTVVHDPGSHALASGPAYLGGIKNDLPYTCEYEIRLKGTFKNNTGGTFTTFRIGCYEIPFPTLTPTGVEYSDILQNEYQLDAGAERFIEVVVLATIPSGKHGVLYCDAPDFLIKKGFTIDIRPNLKTFVRGDEFEFSAVVDPEQTLLDEVKALCSMVGGQIQTDWTTKTVSIYPEIGPIIDGVTIQPFLKVKELAEDLTEIVVPGSEQFTQNLLNFDRYTIFGFAESGDAYIDSLNLQNPALSRKIINGGNLKNETAEVLVHSIEPTVEGDPGQFWAQPFELLGFQSPRLVLPKMVDNLDGNISYDIGHRLVFAYGLVRQKYPTPYGIVGQYAGFKFNGVETYYFGYSTMLRSRDLDPAPTIDFPLAFGSKPGDIYSLFHVGLQRSKQYGYPVTMYIRLSPEKYNAWDFRTNKVIQIWGRQITAQSLAIEDFEDPGDVPALGRFFVPAQLSGCCDGPCGCLFRECTFYQDFGPFMLQATLDNLRISSIIIDGIEQLTAPIQFGFINIVEVGGSPFVTNLVDALNSIGLPYFLFSYSQKVHPGTPSKGLRYFNVKYPACQSWQILITEADGTTEVYKYSNLEQATKWWTPSAWDAFTYGGIDIDAPEDCAEFTEY